MTRRRHAGTAAQHELPGHELAVVLTDCALDRAKPRIGREAAAGPLPDVPVDLAQPAVGWQCGSGPQAPGVDEVALQRFVACRMLPLELGRQTPACPARKCIRLEVADMRNWC